MVEKIPFLVLCMLTLSLAFLLKKILTKSQTKNVPKGSLGYPIIGETFGFIKALKKDKGSDWIAERVSKYGPVFKTSIMGSPTVVIIGQQGNKFILSSSDDVISAKKPPTFQKILGKQSLVELTGSRYIFFNSYRCSLTCLFKHQGFFYLFILTSPTFNHNIKHVFKLGSTSATTHAIILLLQWGSLDLGNYNIVVVVSFFFCQ
jgi:hypothetical protein